MTWRVVVIDRETQERGMVWQPNGAPVAEWYWLAARENADDAGNTMPPDALAELIELAER